MNRKEYVCVNIKDEPANSGDQLNLKSVVNEEHDINGKEDSAEYIYHNIFVKDENMELESSDDDDDGMDWMLSSGESESSCDELDFESNSSENFVNTDESESDLSSNISSCKSDVSENLVSSDETRYDSSFEKATSTDSDESLEDDTDIDDVSQTCTDTRNPMSKWVPVSIHSRIFPASGKEMLCSHIPFSKDGKVWPIDIYKHFLTDEIINLIVVETNRYATQVSKSNDEDSGLCKWTLTNYEEMKKFLGVIFVMSSYKMPMISNYWSKNLFYRNKTISKTMNLERFQNLLGALHFSDNRKPKGTKYQKIAPLMDLLKLQFRSLYTPGSSLVIGETMIPFKNLVPKKHHKFGCKIYKLCTLEGYTLNFEILCQREEREGMMSHPDSLVMNLMANYLDKGATLFTDFTSVTLAESLFSRKTYSCGFIRGKQAGLPSEIVNAKIKNGVIIGKENEKGVKVFNWKDGSKSIIVSTISDHDEKITLTGEVTRKGKERKMPKVALDFAVAKKRVVDLDDEFSPYSEFTTKTLKWYKKVFLGLFTGTCVLNSWIIYNKYFASKKWTFEDFRRSLCHSLLTGLPEEERKPRKITKSVSGGLEQLRISG
ncbi:UNVERIFIED_CONTAM: hypothetical protein RMT77_019411, partial [Armadillidium vulgare]